MDIRFWYCHLFVGVSLAMALATGCGAAGSSATASPTSRSQTPTTVTSESAPAASVVDTTERRANPKRHESANRIVGSIYIVGPNRDGSESGSWYAFFRTKTKLPASTCFPCQALTINGALGQIYPVQAANPSRYCYMAEFETDEFSYRGRALTHLPVGTRVRVTLVKGDGRHNPDTSLAPARTATAHAAEPPPDSNAVGQAAWRHATGCNRHKRS
jgi:hypothetical protein